MSEQNASLPQAPKKSHTLRNIILALIIIGCIAGFIALANFYNDKKSNLSDIISSLGSNVGLDIPTINTLPSEDYVIKQKTSMPFSISAPHGVMDAKSMTDFIIVGQPETKARPGHYGWQTDWKLIINSTLLTSTKTQIQTSRVHTSAITANFTPDTNQYVYYFSLAGVNEGDVFTMRYTMKKLAESTFHFNEKNWIFYDKDNKPAHIIPIDPIEYKTDLPVSDKVQEVTAVLVKNNGNDGAVIAFTPAKLTPEQKAELDRAKAVINQSWWNTQVYDAVTSPPQFPPLKIMLKSGFSEKGYIEEIIENTKDSGSKPKTDGNNNENKVPDLAPLPSASDKNGDGIPDLVPLSGN